MNSEDASEIASSEAWRAAQCREQAAQMRNDLQEAMIAVEEIALRWAREGYLELRTFRYEFDPATHRHEKRDGPRMTEEQAAARIACLVREAMTDALESDAIRILCEY